MYSIKYPASSICPENATISSILAMPEERVFYNVRV
jgi:hypothetical protein